MGKSTLLSNIWKLALSDPSFIEPSAADKAILKSQPIIQIRPAGQSPLPSAQLDVFTAPSPGNDTPSSPEVVFTDWQPTPDNSIPNSPGVTPARVTSASPYPTPTPAQRQHSDLSRNLTSSPLLSIVASSEFVHPSAPRGDSLSISQPHRPVNRKIPRPILPFPNSQESPARVLAPNSDTSGTASQSLFNSQSQQAAFSQPESTSPDQINLQGDVFLHEAVMESVQDSELSQSPSKEPGVKNNVSPLTPAENHDEDDAQLPIDLSEKAGDVSGMPEILSQKDVSQAMSGGVNEHFDDIDSDQPVAALISQSPHKSKVWAEPSFLLRCNSKTEITADSANPQAKTGEVQINEVSNIVAPSKLGGIIFDDIVVDEDLPWMNLLELQGVISRVISQKGYEMKLLF